MNRAERIESIIKSSGFSYRELSERTGLSSSSLQRYATGETSKIPLDAIEKIAAACNVTPEFLMGWDVPEGWEETKKKNGQIAKMTIRMREDDYFLEVVTDLGTLPPELLKKIGELVSTLASK